MIRTAAFGIVLLIGAARADLPPLQPEPLPVPGHPGPVEPDVPETPDNLIVAAAAALAAAGAAYAWRRRRRR